MKRRNRSDDNGENSYKCAFDETTQERLRDYSDRKDQSVCKTVRESVEHFLRSREDDEEED